MDQPAGYLHRGFGRKGKEIMDPDLSCDLARLLRESVAGTVMTRPEIAGETIVLERPSPPEEEPRCKVCARPLPDWHPGMPLICDDHNANRRGPVRNELQRASGSFDEWIQATLWYVAAP